MKSGGGGGGGGDVDQLVGGTAKAGGCATHEARTGVVSAGRVRRHDGRRRAQDGGELRLRPAEAGEHAGEAGKAADLGGVDGRASASADREGRG